MRSVVIGPPGGVCEMCCDWLLQVEFAAPVGYKDETDSGREKTAAGEEEVRPYNTDAL